MKIYRDKYKDIPEGIGDNTPDYDAIYQSGYTAGHTSGYTDGYNSIECYRNMYLTFEIISGGTITYRNSSWRYRKPIEYKLNDNDWVMIAGPDSPPRQTNFEIQVEPGDIVQFRGDNATYEGDAWFEDFGDGKMPWEVDRVKCNIYGNIMSLVNSTGFSSALTLESANTFSSLFYGGNYGFGVVDAGDLVLPATTLADGCYNGMFSYCDHLTTLPKLPATSLAYNCYGAMYLGCGSLTEIPSDYLPGTTLAAYCYLNMFVGCDGLTDVSNLVLPATTLADGCYYEMFAQDENLRLPPELPATTLAPDCYNGMFYYCTSLELAPELPATTLAQGCYDNMFYYTNITEAPELPATTLVHGAYYRMFADCKRLSVVPSILPATALTPECYYEMFSGCESLETAPELPAETLEEMSYEYMFHNCSKLNYVKCLAIDISAYESTFNWLYNVSPTGTFIKNADMNNWTEGVNGIPTDWTVIDA